jgi:hypothetical protein
MSDEKYEEFTLDCPLVMNKERVLTDSQIKDCEEHNIELSVKDKNMIVRHAIALKGNEFYKGCYLPTNELEKCYKEWEGTLHDINHMGTTHIMGLGASSDIRFFVGYQDNIKYNSETKLVAMDIHIDEQTQYGKTWEAYVNLCEKAGKVANVSVTFLAQRGSAKAKDIVSNYSELGFKGDETVIYIKNIRPKALSTVLRGACSDDKGCGIGKVSQNSEGGTPNEETNKQYEQEKQKLIKELKKLDKEE